MSIHLKACRPTRVAEYNDHHERRAFHEEGDSVKCSRRVGVDIGKDYSNGTEYNWVLWKPF